MRNLHFVRILTFESKPLTCKTKEQSKHSFDSTKCRGFFHNGDLVKSLINNIATSRFTRFVPKLNKALALEQKLLKSRPISVKEAT